MLWVQRDAPKLVREYLRAALHDDGTVVRAFVEDGWSPRDGPVVAVVGDGPQASPNATDAELVRVVVRARSLPLARRYMTAIDGLMTTPGSPRGFFIARNRGTGLISGPDDATNGFFASCTYLVGTSRKVIDNGTYP